MSAARHVARLNKENTELRKIVAQLTAENAELKSNLEIMRSSYVGTLTSHGKRLSEVLDRLDPQS